MYLISSPGLLCFQDLNSQPHLQPAFHPGLACACPRFQASLLVFFGLQLPISHPACPLWIWIQLKGPQVTPSPSASHPSPPLPPSAGRGHLILCTSIFQMGPSRAVHEPQLNSRSSVTTPASAISHGSQNDMAPPNPPQGGFTPEEQEKRKEQEARDNAIRRAMLVSPPLSSRTSIPQASTAVRPFEHPARALLLTTLDQDDLGLQRLEELPLQDKGTRYASQPTTGQLRPTMHVAWQGKFPFSRLLRKKDSRCIPRY